MAAVQSPLSPTSAIGGKQRPRLRGPPRRRGARREHVIFAPLTGPKDFAPRRAERKNTSTSVTSEPTSSVARRSARNKRHSIDVTDNAVILSSNSQHTTDTEGTPIPPAIPNASLLEHIATSRFFHHYVSPSRTFFRLDLDYTSSVIDQASTPGSRGTLAEIIIALGILTFPSKPGQNESLAVAARCRYGRALRLTNKMLADPSQATSDEALMAVILLGLYETTPDQSHSTTSWTAHLDGARQLLRIRGREMLKHGPAFRMFSMLRQQILLQCFMAMQPVPEDLLHLSDQISETQSGDDKAAGQLTGLFARVCNLLSLSRDINDPVSCFFADPSSTLAEAVALDRDLVAWAEGLPSSYEYSTVLAASEANAFSDYCHVYNSMFTAEVWILYRTARFGINSLIMSLYSLTMNDTMSDDFPTLEETSFPMDHEPPLVTSVLQECPSTIESLQRDMCATIPFFLHRHGFQPKATADLPLCDRTAVMQYLMSIIRMPGVPDDMYTWSAGYLGELQKEGGIDNGAIWMITLNHEKL